MAQKTLSSVPANCAVLPQYTTLPIPTQAFSVHGRIPVVPPASLPSFQPQLLSFCALILCVIRSSPGFFKTYTLPHHYPYFVL